MKERAEIFVARTRLRGEIDFYDAMWKEWPAARGKYVVKFLKGPHKGEKYEAIKVAKASNIHKGGNNECVSCDKRFS